MSDSSPQPSALSPRKAIDLNCDMGESFGAWRMGQDAEVMPWITSANIACGFHAGDFSTMQQTVLLAKAHGVAIGAHVSLPDLQGFGRREMRVTPDEAYAMTLYQIGALAGLRRRRRHARRARQAARRAVQHGGEGRRAGRRDRARHARLRQEPDPRRTRRQRIAACRRGIGLRVAHEAFADRRYEADGSLTPRREPGAVIDDIGVAVAQALQIATQGKVETRDGKSIDVRADTICVHGDRADAALFARSLREALVASDIVVAASATG